MEERNRFYSYIQASIGHLGDHIGKYQNLVRALVDLRLLKDDEIAPEDEEKIWFVINRSAQIVGMPLEQLVATYQDMEGEGGAGGE